MSTQDDAMSARSFVAADDDELFREFLDAYAPVLRAGFDDGSLAEGADGELVGRLAPADDVSLAAAVAERFFTEEAAVRLFPPEAREILGPPERWRWCLLYVRCCWMFGWLVCRGCRDFRALAYYVYRYWLCARQAVGTPVDPRRLTDAQRRELEQLFAAFGEIYQGWLNTEQENVRLYAPLTDELIAGRFDCCRDDRFSALVFERLFTAANGVAILGREGFAAHQKDPFFWLCRCWCMAAIRFGCCLACARTLAQVRECFQLYVNALPGCFGPLHCQLTDPTGCVADELEEEVNGFAVAVRGTAAGLFFGGYTVEWRLSQGELVGVSDAEGTARCTNGAGWRDDHVVYPGGGASGTVPVVNGHLAWLDTTFFTARSYDVRICVRAVQGPPPPCCCIQFNLFKHYVWIDHVGGFPVRTPPGPFDPDAEIVDSSPNGRVVPLCGCFTVHGSAWVGECNERKIECFDLRYAPGCLPGPTEAGFDPSVYTASLLHKPVCYTGPDEDEKRAQWNQVLMATLTTELVQTSVQLFPKPAKPVLMWKKHDYCFDSGLLPACPDLKHACHSGQYTILLAVTDTQGNHYYDTQCIWVDNKPIHGALSGFDGVKECSQVSLRELAGNGGCAVPWPRALMGMVYDEYIELGNTNWPSDNFDFYSVSITRGCGGPTWQVPITYTPPAFDAANPYHGTWRVGEPGTRCEQSAGCPPLPSTMVVPPASLGVLTVLDIRAFDAVCAGSLAAPFAPPPGFALQRGECCGYVIRLYGQDRSRNDAGVCHVVDRTCAVCICNDLPRRDFVEVAGLEPQATDRPQPLSAEQPTLAAPPA